MLPRSSRALFVALGQGATASEIGARALIPFKEAQVAQARGQAGDFYLLGEDQIAVTIHGHEKVVSLMRPYDVAHEDVLWRMTFGYLHYGLRRLESTTEARCLVTLAERLSCEEAWCSEGAFSTLWHPYACSHRLLSLIVAMLSLGPRAREEQRTLLSLVGLHAAFVSANREYDIHYNHLAKNLVAILASEILCCGAPRSRTSRQLRKVIEYQVLDDGGHAELCPMYHNLLLSDLASLSELPRSIWPSGLHDWLIELVQRMRTAARTFSFSDGDIAIFGDSWRGEGRTSSGLGVDCDARDGLDYLPKMGYAKVTSGPVEIIIDVGAAGAEDNAGHAHDDFLSIECALSSQRVIVDYGVETYLPSSARAETRAARNHNGPTCEQAFGVDAWGSFRVGERSPRPEVRLAIDRRPRISAKHTPLRPRGLTVFRHVIVIDEASILIIDEWSGPEVPGAASSFILSARSVNRVGNGFMLRGCSDLGVWPLIGSISVQANHYFELYGVRSPAVVLRLAPDGASRRRIALLLGRRPNSMADVMDRCEELRAEEIGEFSTKGDEKGRLNP